MMKKMSGWYFKPWPPTEQLISLTIGVKDLSKYR